MTFDEYQAAAAAFAVYPNVGSNLVYPVLGLNGEAGEVADTAKRIARDDGDVLTPGRRDQLERELGDVLWYLSCVAAEAGISLGSVASVNLAKLTDRRTRGALHGEGSDR